MGNHTGYRIHDTREAYEVGLLGLLGLLGLAYMIHRVHAYMIHEDTLASLSLKSDHTLTAFVQAVRTISPIIPISLPPSADGILIPETR